MQSNDCLATASAASTIGSPSGIAVPLQSIRPVNRLPRPPALPCASSSPSPKPRPVSPVRNVLHAYRKDTTGHSLGAALTTLFVMENKKKQDFDIARRIFTEPGRSGMEFELLWCDIVGPMRKPGDAGTDSRSSNHRPT